MNPFYTFTPARVKRTYQGGARLNRMFPQTARTDMTHPECWLVSDVEAKNAGEDEKNSGISLSVEGRYLHDLLEQDGAQILGEKHIAKFGRRLGVLSKVIDAGERLTIQVHPTREKAWRYFRSPFGKTECWYVLPDGRHDKKQYVYAGFRPGIDEKIWRELYRKQDIKGMIDCLHQIPVCAGETILIPGGIPHAIGNDCLLLEIQEPSDVTLRVERITPSGLMIPEEFCHRGIGLEAMFDCFDYHGGTLEETVLRLKIQPKKVYPNMIRLVGKPDTDCFSVYALTISAGEYASLCFPSAAVMIPVSGEGRLWDDAHVQEACVEVTHQLLLCQRQRFEVQAVTDMRVLLAFPPEIL